jgi:AraC-like DNA-binding protein
MTKPSVPIYKEQGKTYHADSCEPVREAVAHGELVLEALARTNYPGRPLADDALKGLQTVGYWDATHPQQWGLPWHRNEGIELTFLETGSMPFAIADQNWTLEPGSLTITRPWQPHKVGLPSIGIGRLHWIIIDVDVRQPHQEWKWPEWFVMMPADLRELTACLRENEQPVWPSSPEIQNCFRQIGKTIRDQKHCESRLAVYINELFLHLLEMFRDQQVSRTKSLTEAQRSAELFLASLEGSVAEEWTLDSMAECCGLGVTRFVHYCRLVTNQTPMHYLNHLRLAAATEMLTSLPEKSITDIAFDCGFSSSQYFATSFRQQNGCTPRQYRSR